MFPFVVLVDLCGLSVDTIQENYVNVALELPVAVP